MEDKYNYMKIIDVIIEECGSQLNDWEMGFIDDIQTKYFENPERLTNTQKKKILQIRKKHLGY